MADDTAADSAGCPLSRSEFERIEFEFVAARSAIGDWDYSTDRGQFVTFEAHSVR